MVADTSALFSALTDDGSSGVLARDALRAHDVHAPALVDVEFLQTIRRKVLAGIWSVDAGRAALDQLVAFPLQRHDHLLLLRRCWELRDSVSAYDAQYVALAELLGAVLVTADVRLSRAPGLRCEVRVLTA
ncbi:type II toxin-antitoxin system VapC family toxin [Klenkia sp. PcliD-1-E]|uniref:type II toxin-antitoxin system VapC family toxin n=1 Tax=Klenkia sp. PcliD-1-E TaxID=2954492 RepID=UPI0027DFFD59|nr:type II toxin-antitoxin system VapC family toxin [Klenkia sp. PcliD-1-E]